MATHAHSVTFFAITMMVVVLSSVVPASIWATPLAIGIVCGLIFLVGLPHGALDLFISQRAGFWSGATSFVGFHLVYLSIAAAVVFAFLAAPVAALSLFLMASVLHFADDWNPSLPFFVRIVVAMAIILLPTFFHPAEVAAIFTALTGVPLHVEPSGFPLAAIWLVGGSLAVAFWRDWRVGTEILSIFVLAWALPPLVFFVAYFGGLHSVRHMIRHRACLQSRRSWVLLGVYSVSGAIAAGVAVSVLWPTATLSPEQNFRIIFIGLAALTFPHMGLLELVKPARRHALFRTWDSLAHLYRLRRPEPGA